MGKSRALLLETLQSNIKIPEGYEVSYCDGIDGAYKGSINSKEPLTVFFRKEGWIDIGGNRWTPEKHFDIVDIR